MANKTKGVFRIGTSNIVVPGPKHTFPEEYQDKSRLTYYASLFNSLEVNSTFYKLPMARTFEKWASEVPDDFQFTVKLSKDITHAKGLLYEPEAVKKFMTAADGLGDKKGCLLIQFPGSITVHNASKVSELLEEIEQYDSKHTWRKAIEFRHHSWYKSAIYDLLHQYKTALVIQDMPKSKTPDIAQRERFIFRRYHGSDGDYRGSYHEEHLQAQAEDIKKCLGKGKDAYAYFNNTMGDAFNNAMMLQELVKQ